MAMARKTARLFVLGLVLAAIASGTQAPHRIQPLSTVLSEVVQKKSTISSSFIAAEEHTLLGERNFSDLQK